MSVMTFDVDDGKNWTITFEDVPDTAFEKYKNELKSKGFKIDVSITTGEGNHLTASKEDLFVSRMTGKGQVARYP